MAILTRTGRSAIASALQAKVSYMAWGIGDGAWTTTWPSEDADATELIAEVGRRKATSIQFVVPDADGEFEIAGAGRFSVSATPTRQLLYTFKFDFADASDQIIRELGIFINVETDPGLPPGQMYFTPDQIIDQGDLLQLEHRSPIVRSSGTRDIMHMLITI